MRGLLHQLSFWCMLALPLALFAQPDTTWTVRIYDTSGPTVVNPTIYGATNLSNGDFAVVGSVTLSDLTTDVFIGRISADGQLLWFRVVATPNTGEVGNAVVEGANGNLIVAGGGSGMSSLYYAVALWGFESDGDSLWSRIITGQGQTSANDIELLPDGNVLVYGYRLGLDNSHSDAWLLKCTQYGDTLWTRYLGGTDTDIGNCILVASDTHYYLGGSSKSVGYGDYDMWLAVVDNSGTMTIQDAAGTIVTERCTAICLSDSFIYLAGRTSTSAGALANGYVARARWNGVFLWYVTINAGFNEEQFLGAVGLPDGGVRCAGWAGTSAINVKPWIADIRSDGVLQNSWTYDGFQAGQLRGIIPCTGGGYLTWGTINEGGVTKGLVMQLGVGGGISGIISESDMGTPLANVRVGVIGSMRHAYTNGLGQYYLDLIAGTYHLTVSGQCISADTVYNIAVFEDSTTALNFAAGMPDYYSRQTSVNLVAQNRIPSSEPFIIYNCGGGAMPFTFVEDPRVPAENWLSTNPSQGIVPAHYSVVVQVIITANAPDDGIYDYYGFINIRAKSCPDSFHHIPVFATVFDADDRPAGLPADFALHPPYPNPFNAVTQLAFSLPRAADVQIVVYDISGRTVRTLVEERREAGRHDVSFDAGDLPSGVYMVRMNSGSFSGTRKLLLLK